MWAVLHKHLWLWTELPESAFLEIHRFVSSSYGIKVRTHSLGLILRWPMNAGRLFARWCRPPFAYRLNMVYNFSGQRNVNTILLVSVWSIFSVYVHLLCPSSGSRCHLPLLRYTSGWRQYFNGSPSLLIFLSPSSCRLSFWKASSSAGKNPNFCLLPASCEEKGYFTMAASVAYVSTKPPGRRP